MREPEPSARPRTSFHVPAWYRGAAVLLVLLVLGSLIAAVKLGIDGEVLLSNGLAVTALAGMAAFAILDLAFQRPLAAEGA